MQHHDDGSALGCHIAQHRHQYLDGLGIDVGKGLIEQQQLCFLHQGAANQGALALAARELAQRAVGQM